VNGVSVPAKYREKNLITVGLKRFLTAQFFNHREVQEAELIALAHETVLLLEEQNGFRKGRSCMDCIFSASQIIEKQRI
jgi:hypothetical protein